MITVNLHVPKTALAEKYDAASVVTVKDDEGSGVTLFLRGADHFSRAKAVAAAINAAIGAKE